MGYNQVTIFKSVIEVNSKNWDLIKSYTDDQKIKDIAMNTVGKKR